MHWEGGIFTCLPLCVLGIHVTDLVFKFSVQFCVEDADVEWLAMAQEGVVPQSARSSVIEDEGSGVVAISFGTLQIYVELGEGKG